MEVAYEDNRKMPCLFDKPFKPMTSEDEPIKIDTAPLLVFEKGIVISKDDVYNSSDEEEDLKRYQEELKLKEEQARRKREANLIKSKMKEEEAPRRAKEIELNNINREITKNYLSLGGNEKDLSYCEKCKVRKIRNEDNFNRLSPSTAEYKRGWRFETTCINCKIEMQEYRREKYLEYRLEFNKYNCDCGETFMISKDTTKAKEQLTKHSQSRHHKIFIMVSKAQSDEEIEIKYELFNIGQLRTINKYNKKEDGSYIVSNIPNKKKEQIVKEFMEYDGTIEIPDNILSIHK